MNCFSRRQHTHCCVVLVEGEGKKGEGGEDEVEGERTEDYYMCIFAFSLQLRKYSLAYTNTTPHTHTSHLRNSVWSFPPSRVSGD